MAHRPHGQDPPRPPPRLRACGRQPARIAPGVPRHHREAAMRDQDSTTAPYLVSQLDELPAQRCPCGWTRRAFAVKDNPVATIHLVDIQQDARTHYHKRLTEIYLVISGTGHIEVDGELVPVKPLTALLIRPGCRHPARDRHAHHRQHPGPGLRSRRRVVRRWRSRARALTPGPARAGPCRWLTATAPEQLRPEGRLARWDRAWRVVYAACRSTTPIRRSPPPGSPVRSQAGARSKPGRSAAAASVLRRKGAPSCSWPGTRSRRRRGRWRPPP